MTELQKAKLDDLLNEVSRRGFISTKREQLVDHTYRLPRRLKPYKIGLITDTHFGSTKHLFIKKKKAYEIFSEEKVLMVLHAGDLSDGDGTVYTGQKHEMFLHGADNHIDYIVENYPKATFPTKFVLGNHQEYICNTDACNARTNTFRKKEGIEHRAWSCCFRNHSRPKGHRLNQNKLHSVL
ncbi:MAG TPA: metallophosphoesterase [bacterium]|nr:metallophosphoesterase [bacterium]